MAGQDPSNTRLIAPAAVAALTLSVQAQDSGKWPVRARALYLDSADKDSTGLGLSTNNRTFPEVDITSFPTPTLAAELILTSPPNQTLRASLTGAEIGTTVYSTGDEVGKLKVNPTLFSPGFGKRF